ncbi:MAG TPA: bifunctional alpha,alpha-trehalose-phosphate synthase (UDP-forming)/trehalose-phosphatase, partial [Cytophagales bacterium]|nr:bifunctional alpha,alpha-trehalose-phosphate synthase (UDP-forming)/trehalose-phosphatase [Cytophagales bacterium]
YPMGIDYDKYERTAASGETLEREVRYRRSLGDHKLMLSIDRLDYSKGIPQRLRAFEHLLREYPEYREQVSLLIVVVPSRDQVEKYSNLKDEIELLVGRINGQYGRLNWRPIHYFYRSYPLHALSAFYRMSHVALVTPMRDGMNLVCKEYIASKLDQRGVLILSEMAGASKELSDAILVNPNNQDQMMEAMHRALTMPEEEQKQHMEIMQTSLRRYNIHHWVSMFMGDLEEMKASQRGTLTRLLDTKLQNQLKKAYTKGKKRVLFLDYDGTMVGFTKDPNEARPDKELLDLITQLADDPQNRVIIISGRGRDTLEKWLGHLSVDFIVEHGVWMREQGKDWELAGKVTDVWKEDMRKTLDLYVDRTPGSFIEEKNYSLVWHFRKVETGLGELRSRELCSHLRFLSTNEDLQVLEGDMVVEIKNRNVNKGRGASAWLQRFPGDFTFAAGDDWTDEDTFKAMPKEAYTIKVGSKNTAARFYVESHHNVRAILKDLIE